MATPVESQVAPFSKSPVQVPYWIILVKGHGLLPGRVRLPLRVMPVGGPGKTENLDRNVGLGWF